MIQPVPAHPPERPVPTPAQINVARQRLMMRSGARWFYWIAALSLVNSVLFLTGSQWGFAIGLGMTDLADAFGQLAITGTTGMVVALCLDALIAGGFAGLGRLAEGAAAWAFIVGMVLYALDAALLLWATDWLSVAFHGLALFYLYRGFQACRGLAAATAAEAIPPGMAPPIQPR